MERRTHYTRIIAENAEQERRALHELQGLFENRGGETKEHEIDRTPELEALFEDVERSVDEMVQDWSGFPKPLPVENVHFVAPGSLVEHSGFAGGMHDPLALSITVELVESRLLTMGHIAHELFHLKSPKSAQVKSGDHILPYRSGIEMIDRHDLANPPGYEFRFFDVLEEAIVAESARRFVVKSSQEAAEHEPDIAATLEVVRLLATLPEEDYEGVDSVIPEIRLIPRASEFLEQARVAYAANPRIGFEEHLVGILDPFWETVVFHERIEERERMYRLFDRLIGVSNGEYTDRLEVFQLFARANYSGHYLPLARVVERLLGRGSFRKIGEEFGRQLIPSEEVAGAWRRIRKLV